MKTLINNRIIFLFSLIILFNICLVESFEESNDDSDKDINDNKTEHKKECKLEDNIFNYETVIQPGDYDEGNVVIKKNSDNFNETLANGMRFYEYSRNVTNKLELIGKRFMGRASEAMYSSKLSPECMTSMYTISEALNNGKKWAQNFMNSQPAIALGMLDISNINFGDFDLCLSIKSPQIKNKPLIRGKYCTFGIKESYILKAFEYSTQYDINHLIDILNNIQYIKKHSHKVQINPVLINQMLEMKNIYGIQSKDAISGICIPSNCDPKEFQVFINELLRPLVEIPLEISDDCDYVGKHNKLTNLQISIIVFTTVLALLVFFASTVDLLFHKFESESQSTSQDVLKCFSIVPNLKEIFDLQAYNKKFDGVDGIKAFLTVLVFVLHEYQFGFMILMYKNFLRSATYKIPYEMRYFWIRNFHLLDIFIIIGGFLLCYILLSKLEQWKGKLNYKDFMLFRYLRGQPPLLFATGAFFILPLLGNGPFWKLLTNLFYGSCERNGWKNLVMLNNIYTFPDMVNCVPPAWYLATDFQMFAFAPLIIMPYYYSRKIGLMINIFVILLGTFLSVFPKLVLGYPHFLQWSQFTDMKVFITAFNLHFTSILPIIRMYGIGFLLGYMIRHKRDVYLGGRVGEGFIWVITCFMSSGALYWHEKYLDIPEVQISDMEIYLWLIFSKFLFISFWVWTVFALCTGRAAILNNILSWRIFKMISNLAFEIYLFHVPVIIYRMSRSRDPVTYDDYFTWTIYFSDFIICYLISMFCALLVTKPFANLVTIVMTKKSVESEVITKTKIENALKSN